jgi:fumarate hydratase class I
MIVELTYPFNESKIKTLHAGDKVQLSGRVYTGRDRLHKFLAGGGAAPVNLRDAAIYHCGPVVVREPQGWRIQSAGPTTSIREEPYMAKVIRDYEIRVIIGKGGMGAATLAACESCGCVYLQAPGGAAALLAGNIRSVDNVYLLNEFGPAEAMWELDVEKMDLVVAMDSYGVDLYAEIQRASARRLTACLSV